MIDRLQGTVIERRPTHAVLMCGGVGYSVAVPLSTFDRIPPEGEECLILTRMIVREDAHLLFGFASVEERSVFDHLISVSRVGPKLALAVLSGMSVKEIRRAIGAEDVGMLASIPGVGKRTAERICVELKEKIGTQDTGPVAVPGASGGDGVVNEAVAALVVLGYTRNEAQEAVARAAGRAPQIDSTESLIREALAARTR